MLENHESDLSCRLRLDSRFCASSNVCRQQLKPAFLGRRGYKLEQIWRLQDRQGHYRAHHHHLRRM